MWSALAHLIFQILWRKLRRFNLRARCSGGARHQAPLATDTIDWRFSDKLMNQQAAGKRRLCKTWRDAIISNKLKQKEQS